MRGSPPYVTTSGGWPGVVRRRSRAGCGAGATVPCRCARTIENISRIRMVVSITFATVRMSRLKHVQLFAFRAHDLKKMVKNEYFENLPKICVFYIMRNSTGSQNAGSLKIGSNTEVKMRAHCGHTQKPTQHGSQNAGSI